jgi:hypothetical protein
LLSAAQFNFLIGWIAINFMGAKIRFEPMNNAQLQQHIRLLVQDSHRVFISDHAAQRMRERQVSDYQVLECLRLGIIQRPPEIDRQTEDVKCRVEYFGTARNVSVIVALDQVEPDIVVVTVIVQKR